MDLPTYTSIWRIEKRLYKLYDFRLPMPLPIGQITVFAAIALPYVLLLTLLGLPFSHSLIWLYVLPPGVATWLVTRPVLESKRLPELIRSQLRYLAEPRVWCRMAPLLEKDVIFVTGRVWRLSAAAREKLEVPQAAAVPSRARRQASAPRPALARPKQPGPGRGRVTRPGSRVTAPVGGVTAPASRARRQLRIPGGAGPVARGNAGVFTKPRPLAQALAGLLEPADQAHQRHADGAIAPALSQRRASLPGNSLPGDRPRPMRSPTAPPTRPAPPQAAAAQPVTAPEPVPPPQAAVSHDDQPVDQPAVRPAITVVGNAQPQEPAPSVERALAGPSARRGDMRSGRVTVVPGGHRPGKPDQLQRDRVRAQQPIDGQRRVVVLGCTVGAGQTVTTLLTGELLASLRTDLVAVLDLNPGPVSLARRAQHRPALSQAASLGPSRLAILTAGAHGERIEPVTAAMAFEQATARHQIVLADPSTTAVPRLLAVTDQLVLVAPASATAAQAIGMTFEWLEAHGQGALASGAIMVMNGVSRRSADHVEHAERVCSGQCRAMVRVPWDDQLAHHSARKIPPATAAASPAPQWAGLLSPGTASAYTALAGVLVAALTEPAAATGRVVR